MQTRDTVYVKEIKNFMNNYKGKYSRTWMTW
jgi:hypothetical protein